MVQSGEKVLRVLLHGALFATLGPPIAAALILIGTAVFHVGGEPTRDPFGIFMVFGGAIILSLAAAPISYLIGAIPAALTGLASGILHVSSHRRAVHIVGTGVAGAVFSSIGWTEMLRVQQEQGWLMPMVGCAAGLCCSWIADRVGASRRVE